MEDKLKWSLQSRDGFGVRHDHHNRSLIHHLDQGSSLHRSLYIDEVLFSAAAGSEPASFWQ
jgi:hypothetical protein